METQPEIDDTCKTKEKGNAILLILVGPPGSGKSTFCDHVMRSSSRTWVRICQDTINNGKAGTKAQCLKSAVNALVERKSVFIDRCNLDKEQRADFLKLGGSHVDVHAVVLELPSQLCISRSVKRIGHEGNLQGGKAAAVVNRMLRKKELPELSEGFSRIIFCQNESDVEKAVTTYKELGPMDNLPQGCFGQKKADGKVQLGIMKFLKKADIPAGVSSKKNSISTENNVCSGSANRNSYDIPTLAFPSISTADFQFNNEKACDIIIEKVGEFVNKLEKERLNARVVLVDLTSGSKILSMVKTKVVEKNIDPKRFFTFVGDITKLYSGGGLRCNVIANAANWRLKPGGGGVNAAIFNAAGSELEDATKGIAKSLYPGNAVVVPLPSTSPLHSREGVTHVIHVLGPNMNPNRPNCLDGDYISGCKLLRDAYTSIFDGFLSIVRNQVKLPKRHSESVDYESSISQHQTETGSVHHVSGNRTIKEDGLESESNKKFKGSQSYGGADVIDSCPAQTSRSEEKKNTKDWGSFAQALYRVAIHPEKHKDIVLEASDDIVVINDLYPKAQKHLLVLARNEGLERLSDVRRHHLQLLKMMHAEGLKWAKKFLDDDASLVFRLGYHSAPSMRQLHLHVISQDFNSNHLKNKKHWNSFTTPFFRDSVDVMEEIGKHGIATLRDEDSLLSMELRCHRCKSAHPNMPKLKMHISKCRASFPAELLRENILVLAPGSTS